MGQELDERIRIRAYEIWQLEGCPDDREIEFWLRAEHEILEEPIQAAITLANEVAATLPKLKKERLKLESAPKRANARVARSQLQ